MEQKNLFFISLAFSFLNTFFINSMEMDTQTKALNLANKKTDLAIEALIYDFKNLLLPKDMKAEISRYIRDDFIANPFLKKLLTQSLVAKNDTMYYYLPSTYYNKNHSLKYLLESHGNFQKITFMNGTEAVTTDNIVAATWHPLNNSLIYVREIINKDLGISSGYSYIVALLDFDKKENTIISFKQWKYISVYPYKNISLAWKNLEGDMFSILSFNINNSDTAWDMLVTIINPKIENDISHHTFYLQNQPRLLPLQKYHNWIDDNNISLFKSQNNSIENDNVYFFSCTDEIFKILDRYAEIKNICLEKKFIIFNSWMRDFKIHFKTCDDEKHFLFDIATGQTIPLSYIDLIIKENKPNDVIFFILPSKNYGENFICRLVIKPDEKPSNFIKIYNTKIGLITELPCKDTNFFYEFSNYLPHTYQPLDGRQVITHHFSKYLDIINHLDTLSIKSIILLNSIQSSISQEKSFTLETTCGDARTVFRHLPIAIQIALRELGYIKPGSKQTLTDAEVIEKSKKIINLKKRKKE